MATAASVPPSKPTPARTGCHIGIFQSVSQWELGVFKKAKDALVCRCYHNGQPYSFPTGMKMVACHCGLTSNLLLGLSQAKFHSGCREVGPISPGWANLCLSLQEELLLQKDVRCSTNPFPSSWKLGQLKVSWKPGEGYPFALSLLPKAAPLPVPKPCVPQGPLSLLCLPSSFRSVSFGGEGNTRVSLRLDSVLRFRRPSASAS